MLDVCVLASYICVRPSGAERWGDRLSMSMIVCAIDRPAPARSTTICYSLREIQNNGQC